MPLSQRQLLQNATPWHDTNRFVCPILGCWANLRPPKWKFLPVGRASVPIVAFYGLDFVSRSDSRSLVKKVFACFWKLLMLSHYHALQHLQSLYRCGRILQDSRNMLECWISWLHKTVWVHVLKDVQRNAWTKTVGKEKMYKESWLGKLGKTSRAPPLQLLLSRSPGHPRQVCIWENKDVHFDIMHFVRLLSFLCLLYVCCTVPFTALDLCQKSMSASTFDTFAREPPFCFFSVRLQIVVPTSSH